MLVHYKQDVVLFLFLHTHTHCQQVTYADSEQTDKGTGIAFISLVHRRHKHSDIPRAIGNLYPGSFTVMSTAPRSRVVTWPPPAHAGASAVSVQVLTGLPRGPGPQPSIQLQIFYLIELKKNHSSEFNKTAFQNCCDMRQGTIWASCGFFSPCHLQIPHWLSMSHRKVGRSRQWQSYCCWRKGNCPERHAGGVGGGGNETSAEESCQCGI